MASKRRVGGSVYNANVQRIRVAARVSRRALRRLLEDNPGPQTRATLLARIALEQAAILEALDVLQRYGDDERRNRQTS